MNDVQTQALGLLQKLIETATKTGEFIAGQVPQVIHELLVYNTALDCMLVVVGIGISTCSVIFWKWALKKEKESRYSHGDWSTAGAFVGVIGTTGGVALLLCNTVDLLKITLAPRVWLIEYAVNLAHRASGG